VHALTSRFPFIVVGAPQSTTHEVPICGHLETQVVTSYLEDADFIYAEVPVRRPDKRSFHERPDVSFPAIVKKRRSSDRLQTQQ
jgi:hypothetical protein